MILRILQKLLNWFRRLFTKEKPSIQEIISKTDLYGYEFVEDVPDHLKPGIIYLICNQGYCWQSAMECPCGCKAALFMNHVEDFKPSWGYKIDEKDKISLHPSVDRMVGCKSHFWVREGEIFWA